MQPIAFLVRQATRADIGSLVRMKMALAVVEKAECAVRATEQDWLRGGFGPNARFTAFIAEHEGASIGMTTRSERFYTGWPSRRSTSWISSWNRAIAGAASHAHCWVRSPRSPSLAAARWSSSRCVRTIRRVTSIGGAVFSASGTA